MTNTLTFFAGKATHIFAAKNINVSENILATTINEFVITKTVKLLCFRHLSESRFLLGALHRRNKFANICHDLMQNHLS